jgi:hypothetical protein
MSLREFDVVHDKFEFDEYGPLCFPCCACKHRLAKDDEEPCRTCDHNSNAVEDNAKATGDGNGL